MGKLSLVAYTVICLNLQLTLFEAFTSAEIRLKLRNDGPAILNSRITFFAALEGDVKVDEYEYRFEDNTKGPNINHTHVVISGKSANLTLLVSEKDYEESIYTMKVSVYKKIFGVLPQRIAYGKISFTLTEGINGNIVAGGGAEPIPVGGNVNFTFALYDPSHYFADAELVYIWKFNDSVMFYEKDSVLFNVSTAGRLLVSVSIFAKVPTSNTTFSIKSGLIDHLFQAVRPINNVTVQGSVWMKRGEIMNLEVTCNGTGPYSYCWRVFLNNSTDICDGEEPIMVTQCSFEVIHYFKDVGKYKIGFLIKNQFNEANRTVEIQIYDVDTKPQLSTVIFPIVSCCLGIVIVVIGAAYHLHQRRIYTIEVADFDFQEPVMLMEKSFMGRVKESIKDALQSYREEQRSEKRLNINGSSRTTPIASQYTSVSS